MNQVNQVNQVNSSKLSYRAEIDGLRAIAVVSVILYHAQMMLFGRNWFEGGFIGVDIFFVISGYLITRLILSELQSKGSFSFLNFYERRARRILPMLFVVIFVSIPYAWQKLLPSDFVEYSESILAALFFGSNFFFYFSTTEYGAESALLKPFLHTWSLGVEEQFYLVFPILAIAAFKYFRKHFLTIIVGLSLLSLQFSELMEVRNADLNFYLPFSRFWELAVGSMLAYRELYYKPSNEGFASKSLPMIGLYLIAYSILFFDAKTPHPSFYTLIPIFGVALIIGFASKDELVGKVLGSKPFVWVGLISYSAYLWHFPIFAFSRIGEEPTNYDKFEWVVITFILSTISYFLIEKVFRARNKIQLSPFLIMVFVSICITSSVSYSIKYNNGYEHRFLSIYGFENYEIDNVKLRKESHRHHRNRRAKNPNFLDVKNKILIIGNSHSKDFYNALVQNGYLSSDMDILRARMQIRCANENIMDYSTFRDQFYSHKNYKDASIIVISTRYSSGQCFGKDKQQTVSEDVKGLPFLIMNAKESGKRVVVLSNSVEFEKVKEKYVADFIYEQYKDDDDTGYKFEQIKAEADSLLWTKATDVRKINKQVRLIADELEVDYFDKAKLMCEAERQVCSTFTSEGSKTLYDNSHWTWEGAKFFGERLSAQGFDDLLK